MPGNLLNTEPQSEIPATNEPVNEDDLGEIQSSPLSPNINFLPEGNADSGKNSFNSVPSLPDLDYRSASLEDLLREVCSSDIRQLLCTHQAQLELIPF